MTALQLPYCNEFCELLVDLWYKPYYVLSIYLYVALKELGGVFEFIYTWTNWPMCQFEYMSVWVCLALMETVRWSFLCILDLFESY